MILVTAIIILLVLTVRGISRREELRSIRNDTANNILDSKSKKEKFLSKYVDLSLESKALSNKVEMDLVKMEIRKKVCIEPSNNMLMLVIMAKHGKIPYEYASNGISNLIHWGGNKSIAGTFAKAQQLTINQFKFIKWYNQFLMDNGMDDDQLYYIAPQSYKTPNRPRKENAMRVSDMNSIECGGFYFWDGTQPLFEASHSLY